MKREEINTEVVRAISSSKLSDLYSIRQGEAESEFDTWLTEERAKVWDKAVDTLSAHYEDIIPGIVKDLESRNPYRAT